MIENVKAYLEEGGFVEVAVGIFVPQHEVKWWANAPTTDLGTVCTLSNPLPTPTPIQKKQCKKEMLREALSGEAGWTEVNPGHWTFNR